MAENSAPLTVGTLKELLEAQTNDIKKIETTLKSEIKKSENEVKTYIEERLLDLTNTVNLLKSNVAENSTDIKDIKKQNDREKRQRNVIIFKVPEEESNTT